MAGEQTNVSRIKELDGYGWRRNEISPMLVFGSLQVLVLAGPMDYLFLVLD
jgi:hypothetical protein